MSDYDDDDYDLEDVQADLQYDVDKALASGDADTAIKAYSALVDWNHINQDAVDKLVQERCNRIADLHDAEVSQMAVEIYRKDLKARIIGWTIAFILIGLFGYYLETSDTFQEAYYRDSLTCTTDNAGNTTCTSSWDDEN